MPAGAQHTLAISRLEAHYFRNSMFLEEDFIINNIEKLSGLPTIIVQGRYDIVCPMVNADKLARSWPDRANILSTVIIKDAGQSALEPGTRRALVLATDTLKDRY